MPAPLLACAGDADPACPAYALASWADVAGGGFEFKIFAGSHFFAFDQPRALLRYLFRRGREVSPMVNSA